MNPFSLDQTVQVNGAAVRRIRRGHLWIYAGDLERGPEGDPVFVRVADGAGNELGTAFYSPQSQIRLRLFTRSPEVASPELLRARIESAVGRRRGRIGPSSACRLVFAEGDLLPGIIVDRYSDRLVLQTLSRGADALKTLIADILEETLHPAGILERNDVRARRLEGLDEVSGVLRGEIPGEIEIAEDGVRFIVDLRRGQKTGFFLDQSDNRVAAKTYASGRALDCFTHTGAFALHFASRCQSVLGVDASPESAAMAGRNSALNGFDNTDFREGNVFDLLRELERAGETFDTICLDPPAFAKNRKSIAGARSGYKEINLRALKLLRPEGVLITSSCSYHMSEADFFDLISEAARDCRRPLQLVEKRGQAADHPSLAGMPETYYLKCFILRAL
ncbi:MAG: class I SAM-dependent rRNA methyltransferase [Acidobacteria bacterium]|nr:class I SAM-dependent rRNA methyltransferase [Acidobacteriota bacterium]